MELCDTPIHRLHAKRLAGEISTADIARSVIQRLETVEPTIRAFVTLTTDNLETNARAVDAKLARKETVFPLEGMPITLKDIFCTQGVETTCGSEFLKGFVPPFDATVVARLKAQGLNLVGKTNMDEFAMGSSTENSAFGPTRNPWDTSRVPGGSSGGTAAAVAAGEALGGIGTDTGGSIRQPASFTSLVGLKPTYGRVSRYGMVAFASSLDQAGPLARDVTDAALLLGAISGQDPRDATSSVQPTADYTAGLSGDLKGVKIGLVKEFQTGALDADVEQAFAENLRVLRSLGADIVEVSLPSLQYAVAIYYILAPCEASSNLGRYDGVRYGRRDPDVNNLADVYRKSREHGFGPEVKRRIMLGTFALSAGYYDAYYNKAMGLRRWMAQEFEAVFSQVDFIASPTSPVVPFKLGEKLADPMQMYLVDAFTLPANLAGIPGISVPGGFSGQGLPLGLQLMAGRFQEARLLQAAFAFETAAGHHARRPPLK
ncbi:MAG: Asp-tRNA(Asn)/Glu-tRNA(Gln) amidotransferase subunit GatA [Deltaproteobacteria bacterium]|nr:Asp-tRNA(Asn)/Glu-tRNA(Gln) amidotransferase subunit GatA [Deltaproteobacteria bacterium]